MPNYWRLIPGVELNWEYVSDITIPGAIVTCCWLDDPAEVRDYFWYQLMSYGLMVAVAYFD